MEAALAKLHLGIVVVLVIIDVIFSPLLKLWIGNGRVDGEIRLWFFVHL